MQIDGRQPAAAAQPMSEDCLYLNVWTAADGKSARLPVIVWSHCGSFWWALDRYQNSMPKSSHAGVSLSSPITIGSGHSAFWPIRS